MIVFHFSGQVQFIGISRLSEEVFLKVPTTRIIEINPPSLLAPNMGPLNTEQVRPLQDLQEENAICHVP